MLSEKQKSSLRLLKNDPIKFVQEIWGVEPTKQQAQGLRAVKPAGSHTSIRSGHGTGKTTTCAWSTLWFVGTRLDCRVPCTAPSKTQLYDVLWAEISKWHSMMPPEWKNAIRVTKDRVMLVGAERRSFAVARTSRRENPEALQGFHAKHILYIIEEASGIWEEVFQVAEGALSSKGARVLMVSNPTRPSGYFYASHHKDREWWKTLHFDSTKSPLVDPEWCERMRRKYGEQSPIYQVRVLGNFPDAAADQFIPLSLLEAAQFVELDPSGPIVWGLDPAYFGDNYTALAKRHGRVIPEVISVNGLDTMQVVGWVIAEIEKTPKEHKPELICIDSTGMGVGIADRLRELRYPVVAVNFSERPANNQAWGNLRTELWAKWRERLEMRQIRIPMHEALIGEASSAIFTYNSVGKQILEPKKEARKRGIESPDHADAAAITFYNEPAYGSAMGLLGPGHEIVAEVDYDPFAPINY